MTIACHITFHNNPSRRKYLRESIIGLLGIPGMSVFVHTNDADGLMFDDRRITLVVHDMTGLHPNDIARMSRSAMATQVGQFDYYTYMTDDILFSYVNFEYYLKYHNTAKYNGVYVGFIRYEVNASDGSYCFTDISRAEGNFSPVAIGGHRFFTVSENQYHAMWLLDRDEMSRYVSEFGDLFFLRTLHYRSNILTSAAIGPIYDMFRCCIYSDESGVLVHHIPDDITNGSTCFGKLRVSTAMSNVCTSDDCIRI